MAGGIRAWNGLVAEGEPEAGIVYFPESSEPRELIAFAWLLEEGSRKFYSALPSIFPDEKDIRIFHDLSTAEEHHKESLLSLYKTVSGQEPDVHFPHSVLGEKIHDDIMEGGVHVQEALRWVTGKNLHRVLEISMSLETNAYDLYLKMHQRMGEDRARKVFLMLAKEEKQHLARLAALLEKMT
ncbi:MAG: ferritin family protein [Nitrospirota bacterium]